MSEEIEEKARKMGWVPEEEWKGDIQKWRPADEFVERGENIVPILKDRLEKMEKELEIISKVNKEELQKVKDKAYEQAKKEYDKQIADLNAKKFEAIQSADVDEYTKVENEINKLPKPEPPEEKKQEVNPVFEDWRKKNTWYAPDLSNVGDADETLTLFANAVAAKIQQEKPNLSPDAFFAEVEKRVKAEFPAKFTNQRREKPDLADSGHPSDKKSKKTWSDLPDEAKSAYKRAAARLKQAGREFSKDDYVKSYFEED